MKHTYQVFSGEGTAKPAGRGDLPGQGPSPDAPADVQGMRRSSFIEFLLRLAYDKYMEKNPKEHDYAESL
jgi:hypothetical protein